MSCCRWPIRSVLAPVPAREAELDPQPADVGRGGVDVQSDGATGHRARGEGAEAAGEAPVPPSGPPPHRAARFLHGHRRWRPHPVYLRYLAEISCLPK